MASSNEDLRKIYSNLPQNLPNASGSSLKIVSPLDDDEDGAVKETDTSMTSEMPSDSIYNSRDPHGASIKHWLKGNIPVADRVNVKMTTPTAEEAEAWFMHTMKLVDLELQYFSPPRLQLDSLEGKLLMELTCGLNERNLELFERLVRMLPEHAVLVDPSFDLVSTFRDLFQIVEELQREGGVFVENEHGDRIKKLPEECWIQADLESTI
eukprot:GHVH01012280.1.p1 GENE.GHVH01012280.1~~GHVH01012280.1.p1  ORF type:complete len:218 (+),score=41.77 GHVH01012280.1:26-655(+)